MKTGLHPVAATRAMLASNSRGARILWLGLLGLVVLFFFSLLFETIPLETRLQNAVSMRLDQVGYKRVQADASGRDILLSGQVASMQAKDRVTNLAAGIPGVRIVSTNFDLQPVRLPFFHLRRDSSGHVAVQAEFSNSVDASLADELARQTDASTDRTITISPETGEAGWLGELQYLIEITEEIDVFSIEVGGGLFEVRGALSDPAQYQVMISELTGLADRSGMQFANGIGLAGSE